METTLTLPRIAAYRNYWRQHPPTHMLVARYMGYKPDKKGEIGELISMFEGEAIK